MSCFRLLVALLALLAFGVNGQACLLLGQHVAAQPCAEHGEEGGHGDEDAASCSSCTFDASAAYAAAPLPLPPLAEWVRHLVSAELAKQRDLALLPEIAPSPPDPARLRRAFACLTRVVPARGPNLMA